MKPFTARVTRSLGSVGLAWLAAACASSSFEPERISRVPSRVLTAEDLRTRVGRLGRELGVVTEAVTVQGQCLSDCAPSSTPGKCVAMFGEREGGKPFAALLDQQAELEPGTRYVLQGSVELSVAVRDRWLLRAEVLAVVVPE